ncbi:hypothetical protein [Bradyrhizobium sp. CCBAU 53415]|uniref:hypothetical protein n=1 Tax=Bradyrhizobium sp. CCBAU 53415 TaxID=1325119 RepID=UPI002304DA40|nr:hypothetical protein [Bradyrhizobium sp. CCBAU 53415]MDA9468756.1 hypothetical protein [Bradyrhizobium sp. CCBAU 53415]
MGRVAEDIGTGATSGRIARDAPDALAPGVHSTQIARAGHGGDSIFDTNKPLDVGKQAEFTATRPVATYAEGDPRSVVGRYIASAEPKLIGDLASLSPPLSKATIEIIIKNDLATTAQNLAKAPDANVSFDVLSGKLKVNTARVVGGVKVSGGEINIYVVGSGVTAAVLACNAVSEVTFKNCIDAGIKKAMAKVFDDIRPATARKAD